jgi:hypothetical protein
MTGVVLDQERPVLTEEVVIGPGAKPPLFFACQCLLQASPGRSRHLRATLYISCSRKILDTKQTEWGWREWLHRPWHYDMEQSSII